MRTARRSASPMKTSKSWIESFFPSVTLRLTSGRRSVVAMYMKLPAPTAMIAAAPDFQAVKKMDKIPPNKNGSAAMKFHMRAFFAGHPP
jgi:hypothetical protein